MQIHSHHDKGDFHCKDFMRKVTIEIPAKDDFAKNNADAICDSACAELMGDGRIVIIPAEEAIRIRTNKTADAVVSGKEEK